LPTAVIFDIQRFSLHDGPGIRTTVFFKGCPLSCLWCQNPESLAHPPEMAFYQEYCRGCLACREVCPQGAVLEEAEARIDFKRCDACGQCVDVCPTGSLRLIGKKWVVADLLEEVVKDRDFFQDSGGGVTLSGGEPLVHEAFLREFVPELKKPGIHITLETAGMYPWERLAGLLPHLDLIYYDLKHMDGAVHQEFTGFSNQRILDNFSRLASLDAPLVGRMPLIPGINETRDNLKATARFLRQNGQETIHCLKYHNLGQAKLARINSGPAPLELPRQQEQDYDLIVDTFNNEGIDVVLYD
jgi:glycyl-radical enzyme activating protein